MMRKFELFLCFVFINLGVFSRGELFSAFIDIEPLLTTHKRVADDLHDYIIKEEARLHILKRYLKVYQREHVKAMEDIPNYLGNPINAFTLIKRMTTDLEFLKLNIDLGAEHASNIGITQYDSTYPSAEDLRGAALAISRLQETYLLKVEDLAEGILNGVIQSDKNDNMIAVSSKMSASDCFELGRVLLNESYSQNALDWMIAALNKFKEENNFYLFEEIDILHHISLSHYFLGNNREALKWAKKILELDPDHSDAIKNIIEFQKDIEAEEATLNGEVDEIVDEKNVNISLKETKSDLSNVTSLYNALCRGEVEVPPVISKELKCRYFDGNSFLKLAPIKMEYKYQNPDIVVFYEVLSDEEIDTIKKIAQPRLKRALLFNARTSKFAPGDNRISKSAWLADNDSPVVERVTRRIADFTGLDMGTAEYLQVVNYGIGGYYSPHYDYAKPMLAQQFSEAVGNRIATVLIYMSDVAQGGATVFTKLGVSIFPVRGAAAVWLNLHASGEGDRATVHAACPVLRGSKWVSNKWIHIVGQEFRRPCGLEYQAENMTRALINPVINKLSGVVDNM